MRAKAAATISIDRCVDLGICFIANGVSAKFADRYVGRTMAHSRWQQESNMAKGQQRSNKEARKPKKAKEKTNASNPSQKTGQRGLENLKNS